MNPNALYFSANKLIRTLESKKTSLRNSVDGIINSADKKPKKVSVDDLLQKTAGNYLIDTGSVTFKGFFDGNNTVVCHYMMRSKKEAEVSFLNKQEMCKTLKVSGNTTWQELVKCMYQREPELSEIGMSVMERPTISLRKNILIEEAINDTDSIFKKKLEQINHYLVRIDDKALLTLDETAMHMLKIKGFLSELEDMKNVIVGKVTKSLKKGGCKYLTLGTTLVLDYDKDVLWEYREVTRSQFLEDITVFMPERESSSRVISDLFFVREDMGEEFSPRFVEFLENQYKNRELIALSKEHENNVDYLSSIKYQ